jgi:hypothetical protein
MYFRYDVIVIDRAADAKAVQVQGESERPGRYLLNLEASPLCLASSYIRPVSVDAKLEVIASWASIRAGKCVDCSAMKRLLFPIDSLCRQEALRDVSVSPGTVHQARR